MITKLAFRAILVASVVIGLCGCAPGTVEQSRFLDAAGSLSAPDDFAALDAPAEVCAPLSARCEDPAVITSWTPALGRVSAFEYCTSFLNWAETVGITKVWVQREGDWQGWYEPSIHAMVNAGSVPTGVVGVAQTVTDCAVAVDRTLDRTEADGQRERFSIVGITGVPGVAGGLLVARLMPPRFIDDSAIRDTGKPYMIVAYLALL